jgi:hypothetical protein
MAPIVVRRSLLGTFEIVAADKAGGGPPKKGDPLRAPQVSPLNVRGRPHVASAVRQAPGAPTAPCGAWAS